MVRKSRKKLQKHFEKKNQVSRPEHFGVFDIFSCIVNFEKHLVDMSIFVLNRNLSDSSEGILHLFVKLITIIISKDF